MTKYLVTLALPELNIASSESTGKTSSLPFTEKIGNIAVLNAFNIEEAKKKALKLFGENKGVEKYLRVFNLEEILNNWSYFQKGGQK